MQFVHVSKDAMPQKAQGGFVTASLAALILLASSSSASLFFFVFNAAASLHAVLWADQCSSWRESSTALRRSPNTSSRQACRRPRSRDLQQQSEEEGVQTSDPEEQQQRKQRKQAQTIRRRRRLGGRGRLSLKDVR